MQNFKYWYCNGWKVNKFWSRKILSSVDVQSIPFRVDYIVYFVQITESLLFVKNVECQTPLVISNRMSIRGRLGNLLTE